jgi:general stress protein YciG
MTETRRPRGFAAMSPETQRRIASMGGRAAHEGERAHEFTSAEARKAGRRGGKTVSQDRAHMAEIGRLGGIAAGKSKAERAAREVYDKPVREFKERMEGSHGEDDE